MKYKMKSSIIVILSILFIQVNIGIAPTYTYTSSTENEYSHVDVNQYQHIQDFDWKHTYVYSISGFDYIRIKTLSSVQISFFNLLAGKYYCYHHANSISGQATSHFGQTNSHSGKILSSSSGILRPYPSFSCVSSLHPYKGERIEVRIQISSSTGKNYDSGWKTVNGGGKLWDSIDITSTINTNFQDYRNYYYPTFTIKTDLRITTEYIKIYNGNTIVI